MNVIERFTGRSLPQEDGLDGPNVSMTIIDKYIGSDTLKSQSPNAHVNEMLKKSGYLTWEQLYKDYPFMRSVRKPGQDSIPVSNKVLDSMLDIWDKLFLLEMGYEVGEMKLKSDVMAKLLVMAKCKSWLALENAYPGLSYNTIAAYFLRKKKMSMHTYKNMLRVWSESQLKEVGVVKPC